jgi:hypothetical protein
VPFWITKGDQEIKLSFLRGIFDDEATVNYDQKRHNRRVILAMGKKLIYKQSLIGFMGQIKDLLTTSGVQTGKICAQEVYGDRIMLRFGIYRRQSLENFLYKIGFTHKRKAKILRDMTHTYLGVNTSKKKILETITKSTKPLTTREIAKITHLKYSTVKFHVRDMFDQSMIDKIEERPCRWI